MARYVVTRVDLIGRPGGRGPRDAMNLAISGLGGVRASTKGPAEAIKARAEAIMAPISASNGDHDRDPRESHFTVTRGVVDHYVNFEHPAALAVEFGHFAKRNNKGQFSTDGEPEYIEGVAPLRRAAFGG